MTQQEYVDELYAIQCCIGSKKAEIVDYELIGANCSKQKNNLHTLYLYLETLKRQNVEDNLCLTTEEILCILERARILCGNCKTCS